MYDSCAAGKAKRTLIRTAVFKVNPALRFYFPDAPMRLALSDLDQIVLD